MVEKVNGNHLEKRVKEFILENLVKDFSLSNLSFELRDYLTKNGLIEITYQGNTRTDPKYGISEKGQNYINDVTKQ